MPMVNANGKLIFFAHAPKTGGSSIEEYLIRRFGDIWMHRSSEGSETSALITPPQHMTNEDLAYLVPKHGCIRFATVRDPITRIVSEYNYQSSTTRIAGFQFSTWLRIVVFAAQIDPRVYDNHIRPQTQLIPEGTNIFRLEHGLEQIQKWLDDVTNSSAPHLEIGHKLKSEVRNIKIFQEDLIIIKRFYASDYQRFNYTSAKFDKKLPSDPFAMIRTAFGHLMAVVIVVKQRHGWNGSSFWLRRLFRF